MPIAAIVGKPRAGARIDWGHPLAQSLRHFWAINEGSGSIRDMVTGAFATPIGTPTWRGSAIGTGVASSSSGVGWDLGTQLPQTLDNFTVAWYGIPRSFLDNTTAFSLEDFGESDVTAGRDAIIFKPVVTGGVVRAEAHIGGTGGTVDGWATITQDQPVAIVFVRVDGVVSVYSHGVLRTTRAVGTGMARTFQFPRLGNHRFSGTNQEFTSADHGAFLIANRPWSATEVRQWSANPWCLLAAPSWRRYRTIPAILTATASPSILLSLAPSGLGLAVASGSPSVLLSLAPSGLDIAPATAAPSISLALSPSGIGVGVATAAPSILLSLAPDGLKQAVAAATPSVLLSLGPAASATLGAQASPSILLSLAPSGLDVALATATPSISLALAPASTRVQPASATPSVLLALAPSALDIAPASAAPSIKLTLQASTTAQAQAAPSITLALAPAGRLVGSATATPSILLALGPSAFWLARAQSTPSILLGLTPSATRVVLGNGALSITLALSSTAIGVQLATANPSIILTFGLISYQDIVTVYLVYNATGEQGLIEQGFVTTMNTAQQIATSMRQD